MKTSATMAFVWSLLILIMACVTAFFAMTDHVVWTGEATVVSADIRYNHVGLKMQGADGRIFNIDDGQILLRHVNEHVTIFHCKVYKYGSGSCI
jgi:hypothetical protein